MSNTEVVVAKTIASVLGDAHFFDGFADSFDKRVIAQKAIFLVQSFCGLSLHFPFSWYLAGPYSPGLARSLFSIAENNVPCMATAMSVSFGPEAAKQVEKLRHLIARIGAKGTRELASWLELLSSVVYIRSARELDIEDPSLPKFVREAKPQYPPAKIRKAIEILRAS